MILGSTGYIPSTSVLIWHSEAFKDIPRAIAVKSEPPLPKVVISFSNDTP